MSMNTPIGQITRTSPIKNFTELSKVELEQYLLGINNISQGDGSKVTLQNLITSMVSEDIENWLEIGNDGKLAVKSNALINDTGWVTPPTLTVNWENKTVTGAGGQFMQDGVVVDLLSEFTTSGFNDGNGNYYLYYNSASRELEWSKGYPTVNKDYINHICEIVIMETGSFAIQTWGFGGISKDLIDYLNNTIGMAVLAGGIINGVETGNVEKRKPTISQTEIGTANFNQTFVATQTGETYTQAHVSSNTIVFETGKTEIVPVGATGMAQYLSDSGLTDLEADKYMNVWLFALPTASTNPDNMNYLYITGSGQYDDLASAKAVDFSKDKTIKVLGKKFYKYCPIVRFTIQNSKGNFSIADYSNISSISANSSSGGSSFSGSGLEVCDIGMALYVDETKGLRRYLNGQIVDINTNTQAFLNRLQEITTLHPSLLCTEEEWQTAKTNSAFGQVGKFVFNYSGNDIVSVRIPRVVNVQGLFDLQNLGMTVEAGLPNITGKYNIAVNNTSETGRWNASGAFYKGSNENVGSAGNNATNGTLRFDASRSSSIYGNSTTVQPEAIQYPYFIQIATGSETENNIINEIELNNPYSLFDSKYSDHELNNLSWLKSEGQWNSKAVYPTAYDKLLKVYNGTETVAGLSVKLSTETYTDYDFVLNTTDETFRLPLKNHTADDGKSVLTLYYYVGETVQNANLIDAGRIGEQLANKVDLDAQNLSIAGKSLISGLGMPSYRYVELTLGASRSVYTAPADGYVEFRKQPTADKQWANIYGLKEDATTLEEATWDYGVSCACWNNISYSLFLPIRKGRKFAIDYSLDGTVGRFRFIYAEGSKED